MTALQAPTSGTLRHFLLASDFDQTLSFNDSGHVLAELLGIPGVREKIDGLARSNLVQQGGELAYLIRHDPQFRGVRREHLIETGRRVRLKGGIRELEAFLRDGVKDARFAFFVISAAPRDVVESALAGIVPPEHVYATELDFDPTSGEVTAVRRVRAGYGKVAAIEELQRALGIAPDRVIYVGDGSSDVHVMLHVNNRDGLTIAVSENRQLARIAHRTVLSDSALPILIPVLEHTLALTSREIRAVFESRGFRLGEWERGTTDRVTVNRTSPATTDAAA